MVGCLLILLSILAYVVWYLRSFLSLVSRNFKRIPRSRVLSNMFWIPGNHFVNDHLEISGNIAAALKRGQLSYDQINDQVVLSSLNLKVGVALEPVQIMIYTNSFVGYLDDYHKGFVKKVIYLVLTAILLIAFITMLVITVYRR